MSWLRLVIDTSTKAAHRVLALWFTDVYRTIAGTRGDGCG